MDQTPPNRTNQIIIAVIVIVLIVIGIYFLTRKPGATGDVTFGSPTPTPSGMTQGNNKLVVGDQFPGAVVYVSSATLDKDGFVVVWDENNGAPDKVIGAKYYKAGTIPASVAVSPATLEGKSYYVALYADDGDQKFDPAKDTPLTDDQGNPIMVKFKASKQFEIMKG